MKSVSIHCTNEENFQSRHVMYTVYVYLVHRFWIFDIPMYGIYMLAPCVMTNLLSKKNKFIWTDACSQAFEHVKIMLASEPVLKAPDFTNPFKLYVDASDVGVGSVLLQEDDNSFNHPFSSFFKEVEQTA